MKKLSTLVAFAAAILMTASCGGDRTSVLKVYNWSSYIDESLIPEFEQWYEEQTGEKVKIVYQTFDINETMLSKIEKGHEDYDVVCPSDYIIERMMQKDLLLPVNKDFGDTPNYIDQTTSPHIRHYFNLLDGKGRNANDYAVGYMWGTTGILYNRKYVADEDATTWDIIRNGKYADKIFIKDAARDVYAPVLIYLKRDQLADSSVTLDELMYDSSDESLAAAEAYLKECKEIVAGWEADFGKEQMIQEHGWVNLTWSGDAEWAIEEAREVGVDLAYTVPKEGSTVWFDGWVIPKYAQNIKAANYFINFMCRPDVAIRNATETGYVSAAASPEILEAITDESYEPLDLSYFFGEEATAVPANPVVYPDKSTIDHCSMEHDWGDDTEKLIAMWSRVKGSEANGMTGVIIGGVVVLILAAVLISRNKKKSRHRH